MGGALIGGAATTWIGLGRALWIFGLIQIFSNVGYVLVAGSPVDRPLMYTAMTFESFTQGLGTGAFSALLIRLTQRRFSATQYALYSSLFSIPRIVSGPIAGTLADAMGWGAFFWLTMIAGVPGTGAATPLRAVERSRSAIHRRRNGDPGHAAHPCPALDSRACSGLWSDLVLATVGSAVLDGLRGLREKPPVAFDLGDRLAT